LDVTRATITNPAGQIIVENEDGEVLKKYDLPTQKPQPDLVSQGLKYMGMGVFAKAMDKSGAGTSAAGEASTAAGEPSAQRQRKWSAVDEQEEEDDRHIRFTIGGVGKRMTKEDFINEMQELDRPTRGEVVDKSDASQGLKALAKLDAAAPQQGESALPSSVGRTGHATAAAARATTRPSPSPAASRSASRSPSPPAKPTSPEMPLTGGPETAGVGRSRRLVAPSSTDNGKTDDGETAAERRRREAALGMAPHQADGEEDSDDDDTPRVPPARKAIRFADAAALERGRLREGRKG
jgi:hypothetical protein